MEPLSKLQTTIYNAYLIGLEPSEGLLNRIQALKLRMDYLTDWLYLELLAAAGKINPTQIEILTRFRDEERTREGAPKGAQASAAPASSHTH